MPAPRTTHRVTQHTTVRGIDYVELFVGNVLQASHYYSCVWDFNPVACSTARKSLRDSTSVVLRQANITLVLTGAASSSSAVAEYLRRHGEGIVNIGFAVDDVYSAYEATITNGAEPISEPHSSSDEDGQITRAEVRIFDGLSHTFINRSAYWGCFCPGFRTLRLQETKRPVFQELDHVALAVEAGTLDAWVEFYENAFGFEVAHQENVATEYSGMNSKVVQNSSGKCRFPIVEPALGKQRSQVQDFLDRNNGPGVQHLALQTPDIAAAVRGLQANGVTFLPIPAAYYDGLEERVGVIGDALPALRHLGILVDRDDSGRLFQVFTQSCHDRNTLFFEVVERRGARGFGGANIRALFESIEREQALQNTK